MIPRFQAHGKAGDQSRATFFGVYFSLVNGNLVTDTDTGIIKKCKETRKHFEISFKFIRRFEFTVNRLSGAIKHIRTLEYYN